MRVKIKSRPFIMNYFTSKGYENKGIMWFKEGELWINNNMLDMCGTAVDGVTDGGYCWYVGQWAFPKWMCEDED